MILISPNLSQAYHVGGVKADLWVEQPGYQQAKLGCQRTFSIL